MSKRNTTREERVVDGQLLMLGDRVDSGYNRHGVFYQLRRTSKLWLIYCRTKQRFSDGSSYEEHLQGLKDTPNHPKAIENGWVLVEMESSEQDARETLAATDMSQVNEEFQRVCLRMSNPPPDFE